MPADLSSLFLFLSFYAGHWAKCKAKGHDLKKNKQMTLMQTLRETREETTTSAGASIDIDAIDVMEDTGVDIDE